MNFEPSPERKVSNYATLIQQHYLEIKARYNDTQYTLKSIER